MLELFKRVMNLLKLSRLVSEVEMKALRSLKFVSVKYLRNASFSSVFKPTSSIILLMVASSTFLDLSTIL